jgi:hypothetical protein
MMNVLRCSSFFWVLICFDKSLSFYVFFKFNFILDSGIGFGLFFR